MSSPKSKGLIYAVLPENKINLSKLVYQEEINSVIRKFPADLWFFLWRAAEDIKLDIIPHNLFEYQKNNMVCKAVRKLNYSGIPIDLSKKKHLHQITLQLKLDTKAKKIFHYIHQETTLIQDVQKTFDRYDLLYAKRFNARFWQVFTLTNLSPTPYISKYIPEKCKVCKWCDIKKKLCRVDEKEGYVYPDFEPSADCFELRDFTKLSAPDDRQHKTPISYKNIVPTIDNSKTILLQRAENQKNSYNFQIPSKLFIKNLSSKSRQNLYSELFAPLELPRLFLKTKLLYKEFFTLAKTKSKFQRWSKIYNYELTNVIRKTLHLRLKKELSKFSDSKEILIMRLKLIKNLLEICLKEFIKDVFFYLVAKGWIIEVNNSKWYAPQPKLRHRQKLEKQFEFDYNFYLQRISEDKLRKTITNVNNGR